MDETESNKLMDRIQNGEEEAFREFYNIYSKKIMGVAIHMTQNFHDAENIVNIVMEKIWYGKFKSVNNLDGFVFKTTKFLTLNYLRDNKKNRNMLSYSEELGHEVVMITDIVKQNILIADILGQLKDKYRDIVFKYVLFDDTFQEIAEDMKISKSSVRRIYLRAIKILKQKFIENDII